MTAEMSVQITLALSLDVYIIHLYKICPSAGIGRQDELKLRWYNIVEVQVLFRIIKTQWHCVAKNNEF